MYVKQKDCKTSIRCRCSKQTSFKCKAILITTLERTDPTLPTEHNHPADGIGVKVTKVTQQMKQRAKDVLANPVQIFVEAVEPLQDDVKARMPAEDSAKRTMRNQRTKNLPENPVNIQQLVIEGPWLTTGEPFYHRFLLSDGVNVEDQRATIFATDEGLRQLSLADSWYIDGNFSLAPQHYMQVYAIRVAVQLIYITAVYCLLQNKSQVTYEYVLNTILDRCTERDLFPAPRTVNMDFEKGVIAAIKAVLGEQIIIRGCFYHLCQSTYRKVQFLGLQQRYRLDEDFNHFCGMLDGLAFLPVQDVPRGMMFLREHTPVGAEELLRYFDQTYVTGQYRRRGDRHINENLIPPLFPVETWNVHETTLANGDRTNNHTEGWNNRFFSLVGQDHPSVWILIKKMRQEVASDETKLQQLNLGTLPAKKKRPQYEVLQQRLHSLCEDYRAEVRDLPNFLRAIGHNVRFRQQ